jgi:ribonuclease P protein component
MLKKINRGLKRDDLDELRDMGMVYQSPLFGLSVVENSDKGLKFATIISKKISKKAVDRNRIKRLLMEAVKENIELLKDRNIKAVFLAKKTLLDKRFAEVENEVKKIFKEIKTNEKNSTGGN